ncbi:MAG TPA: flagellar hook capping protein [Firmicutes bacterium]|nr:flagellar hook capping protein [Bacillota bacterium]
MYVTDTTSTTTVAAYQTTKEASQPLASLDNFLKLLLSQIQYQDPLNPVQDHEFIAQLAQFSQLEAVQATNSRLNTIGILLESSLSYQGLQLLGREVDIQTKDGVVTGLVDGVTYENGRPALLVNGQRIELGQVLQVRIAAAAGGGEEGEQ